MIVFIHLTSFAQYNSFYDGVSGEFLKSLGVILQDIIPCVAVPLYMLLAGYAFFRNYTLEKTKEKFKRRTKSLLVPYLFWNTVWMVFMLIISATPLSQFFIARERAVFSIETLFRGIFLYEYNSPFWFMFALMIYTLLSPLLFLVLRSRIRFVFVPAVLILYLFDLSVVNHYIHRTDTLFFYIVGACLAMYGKRWFETRLNNRHAWLWVGICIGIFALDGILTFTETGLHRVLTTVMLTVLAISFWKGFDILKNKSRPLYGLFFAVYAMHRTIGSCICKVSYIGLPKNQWMSIINCIITVVGSYLLIILIVKVLKKTLPKFTQVIFGGRLPQVHSN